MKPGDVFTRSMPVAELELDGDHLEAILVPWETPAKIYGDPEEPEPYLEGWMRGAFDSQISSPAHVRSVALLPKHGSTEFYGFGEKIVDIEAGLYGRMRVLERDRVRAMVEAGIDSVSIEFQALQKRWRERHDGVRWRDRAVLVNVALTPIPAYSDARVLAMREAQLDAEREARIAELDSEIAELRAGGERWKA